jgi:hypothetical protein
MNEKTASAATHGAARNRRAGLFMVEFTVQLVAWMAFVLSIKAPHSAIRIATRRPGTFPEGMPRYSVRAANPARAQITSRN